MRSFPPSRAPFHYQQLGRAPYNDMSKRRTRFYNFGTVTDLPGHPQESQGLSDSLAPKRVSSFPGKVAVQPPRAMESTALVRARKPTRAVPGPTTSTEVRQRLAGVPRANVLGTAGRVSQTSCTLSLHRATARERCVRVLGSVALGGGGEGKVKRLPSRS